MSDNLNKEDKNADSHTSLVEASLRKAFIERLSAGNAKKYAPAVLVSNFDRISEYALKKRISSVDLWVIRQYSVFLPIYNKLMGTKLLRIMGKNTYKVFTVSGQLYLQFLKEMPFRKETTEDAMVVAVPSAELVIKRLFTKKADWSLFNYGFAVPQSSVSAFFEAIGTELNSNNTKTKMALKFDGKLYQVHAVAHGRTIQVRWGINDNIAIDLRSAFSKFYEQIKAIKAHNAGNLSPEQTILLDVISASDCGQLELTVSTSEPQPNQEHIRARKNKMPSSGSPQDEFDPLVIDKLTKVLTERFSNGFRLDSPIEMARLRSFAAEDLGKEITLNDEELENYVIARGTIFDGKVYAVSANAKERIKDLAEEYFADGAEAIFYTEFYAKNENWLFRARVVSVDMLIEILRGLFPRMSFTQTYFGCSDVSVFAVLESEILRVWGDDVLLTYEQLTERLQYISLDRIKYALGQNNNFIWNSAGTFSHICRIDITGSERKAICEAALQECNTHGYFSITCLPLGEIEERNCELSITVIHNAIYRICLSDKFDKKGKIVTRKGDAFDALTIMKEYCRTIDKCSLGDLLTFEKELTGEVHRWIPMEAGNSILVRIDKDIYVADNYAGVILGTKPQSIENTGLCRFNPI